MTVNLYKIVYATGEVKIFLQKFSQTLTAIKLK